MGIGRCGFLRDLDVSLATSNEQRAIARCEEVDDS